MTTQYLNDQDADAPWIFQPLYLRDGPRYRALHRHVFLPAEKLWACRAVGDCRTGVRRRSQRLAAFAQRYSLDEHGLRHWVQQHARGEVFSASTCCVAHTLTYLDAIAVAALNAFPASRAAHESESDYEQRFGDFLDLMLADTKFRLDNFINEPY